jgi:uncharacterized membrane protein (Fun14 family)
MVAIGLTLRLLGGGEEHSAGSATTGAAGGTDTAVPAPNSLVGTGNPSFPGYPDAQGDPAADAGSDGGQDLSPVFLRGGFSFFVAFCVGYATRSWLKIAMMLLGTFFLGVFVLSYASLLEVNWTTLDAWWDQLVGHVQAQSASFHTFLTGSLPNAGLATLGLYTGFKRR